MERNTRLILKKIAQGMIVGLVKATLMPGWLLLVENVSWYPFSMGLTVVRSTQTEKNIIPLLGSGALFLL